MNIESKTQRIESLLYYRVKPVLEIRIDYPCFSGKLSQKSEHVLNSYYLHRAKNLNTYARTKLYPAAVTHFRKSKNNGYEFNFHTFYHTFQPTFLSQNLISLYEDQSVYTSGAHPYTQRFSQTWDVCTPKILKLKNFFVPQFRYADYFIKEIIRQIECSENKDDYFDGVASLVRKYFNENNFYITPKGFVIYYPLYTIAPYYTGIQTFTIPFSCFSPENMK
mgnify:FL=1